MPGRAVLVMIAGVALATGCKDDAPAGPIGLGRRADAKDLTSALVAVAQRPPTERASALAAAVFARCGAACGCLAADPAAPACPAANASVPAGWPALELCGRYLAEQLAAMPARARDKVAGALALVVVPIARLEPGGIQLSAAVTVRPLSLAPVIAIDEHAQITIARHPLVTFGSGGARVTDPPAPTPVTADALDHQLARVVDELGDLPPPPPPAIDAGPDDLNGGFGFGRSGFGPSGGTGWGTIGTGRYGIGGSQQVEQFALSADREPLAPGQPVIVADGRLLDNTLIAVLAPRGGALAVPAGGRVGELAWTFRPGAPIDLVAGMVVRNEPGRVTLEVDGAPQITWPAPLTAADRTALTAELRRRQGPTPTALTVAVQDLTVADLVAALDLAGDAAPQVRLILRRQVFIGSGIGIASTTGPQVRLGQPQAVGDLDKAIIRRYVKRNLARIKYCYERELLVKPALAGTVETKFFISPTGAVTTVEASGVDDQVARCVAEVIERIEFPRPRGGGGVQVTYPFVFRPAP